MALKIIATVCAGMAVLKCEGRITLGEGSVALKDDVKAALRGGAMHIVLDMTGVNYIDSSGIGELVSAFTVTRNSGGNFVLAGVQKKVSDLLKITKLDSVFRTFETAEAAVTFLQSDERAGEAHESQL